MINNAGLISEPSLIIFTMGANNSDHVSLSLSLICLFIYLYIYIYIYIYISGGPLSALTCCVNVRLLSAIKKNIAVNLFSKLGWELGLYYTSYDDFHPDILARMYT